MVGLLSEYPQILFYFILFYSPFYVTLSLFLLCCLLLFLCLPVKQSESTLIPLPALSYTDPSEILTRPACLLAWPLSPPNSLQLERSRRKRERAQDRKREGECEEGAGERRAVIQTANHMSRDLFTNWAGEKSSAPLRGGRAARKGDRKHTGISSLCLENAFYPLCICSGEARPDGVRKTQLWMCCTHKLSLWRLYATALPLSLLRGKRLIVTWGR